MTHAQEAYPGCYDWSGNIPLQKAVFENKCVYVEPGIWEVPSQTYIPSNHVLEGDSDKISVLRASKDWNFSGYDAIVSSRGRGARLRNVTLDGNKRAAIGAGYSDLSIYRVKIQEVRCNGVSINGPNMRVVESVINNNGYDCPSSPPGASIYFAGIDSSDKNFAAKITGNTMMHNAGPGIDINEADNNNISNNKIIGNTNWAGISVYAGAGNKIVSNTIVQAKSANTTPYHPECTDLLDENPGSAAIYLCGTRNTAVAYNTASGFSGIVSIGAIIHNRPLIPTNNVILSNDFYGSNYGCTTTRNYDNTWAGNICNANDYAVQASLRRKAADRNIPQQITLKKGHYCQNVSKHLSGPLLAKLSPVCG
jgi:parallel beta-helix repeat protein